jgi:hypothetical protein
MVSSRWVAEMSLKTMERTFNMRKFTKYFATAFALIALFGLTGCERTLSGTEKDAVLAFSEATVDNLLDGWTANKYAVFSRDFDTDMQKRIPATQFTDLKQEIDNKLGSHISRQVDSVTQADEFYVVTYQAKFEQEKAVEITVAFHISNQSVAFLSFESEDYSWSAWE